MGATEAVAQPGAVTVGPRRLLGDERLAELAVAGDRRAFEIIFDRYHQELYRFCRAIVQNSEDAEDALQGTMAAALRALPGEQRRISLRAWLYRVAHNESISIVRRRRPMTTVEEDTGELGADVAEQLESRNRLRQLVADLRTLPERQRSALVMRELNGLDYDEISSALDASVATVRQTVYQARVALGELEAGREMDCEAARQAISDHDGRVLRGRALRAHVRACESCRDFRAGIRTRRADFAILAPPIPAVAASGVLAGILGSGHGSAAGGLAGAAFGGGAAASGGAGAIGGITGATGGALGSGGVGGALSGALGTSATVKGASVAAAVVIGAGTAAGTTGVVKVPLISSSGQTSPSSTIGAPAAPASESSSAPARHLSKASAHTSAAAGQHKAQAGRAQAGSGKRELSAAVGHHQNGGSAADAGGSDTSPGSGTGSSTPDRTSSSTASAGATTQSAGGSTSAGSVSISHSSGSAGSPSSSGSLSIGSAGSSGSSSSPTGKKTESSRTGSSGASTPTSSSSPSGPSMSSGSSSGSKTSSSGGGLSMGPG